MKKPWIVHVNIKTFGGGTAWNVAHAAYTEKGARKWAAQHILHNEWRVRKME